MRKEYENGIYDIPIEDYHASAGVSRSALMAMLKTPYHYYYEYLSGKAKPREETPAMVMGELVHTLVLEPMKYTEKFYVMPKLDKRTTVGKQLYSTCLLEKGFRTMISEDQVEEANAIANGVRENSIANALIMEHGKVEHSIYFTHQATGLQCKVRPDSWTGSVIVDLKTSVDAGFRGFQSSAYKYGYYLQAGMIYCGLKSIGIDMESFIFVVVEKSSPFATAIYTLDPDALDFGVNQFNELMERLKKCCEADKWPSYGIQNLTVPKYALYDELVEIDE